LSGIRVTYSGLISFAIGLTSVLTGMIFTLIVTRNLTAEEFGTWNLIGGLIIYVIIIEPMVSYWATREIARGLESGKTAFASSGILSVGGVAAYLVIAYFVSSHVNANLAILYFSALLIPVMFLNRTLTAINLGWKPQSSSYGTLSFESSKIPAALLFVYIFHMGITGAILSTVIAYVVSIIVLLIFARQKLDVKLAMSFIKKWFKLSWLSIYPGIYNVVYHLDVISFSVISGSVVGLAFYSAAIAVSNVVGNSSLISQALYPKLLEGGKREHLQENLIRFYYFAFPLAALSIVFAKPALYALKPIYDVVVPVVVFMTVRAFLAALQGIYSQALLGIETVDINEKSKMSDFVKSKLFFIPTVILIQYGIYIISMTVGLYILRPVAVSTVDLVVYWSIISLGTQVPFTIYFYVISRKYFHSLVDLISIIKYIGASIASFLVSYFLLNNYLNYKTSIFEFVPNLLLFASIGIGLYLLITIAIDFRTRKLFQSIINEFKD
jgi:O-antigen/teichoic acid export membrane protein